MQNSNIMRKFTKNLQRELSPKLIHLLFCLSTKPLVSELPEKLLKLIKVT